MCRRNLEYVDVCARRHRRIYGRRLQKNDVVPLKLADASARAEATLPCPLDLALDQPIRVVVGPQTDCFTLTR